MKEEDLHGLLEFLGVILLSETGDIDLIEIFQSGVGDAAPNLVDIRQGGQLGDVLVIIFPGALPESVDGRRTFNSFCQKDQASLLFLFLFLSSFLSLSCFQNRGFIYFAHEYRKELIFSVT